MPHKILVVDDDAGIQGFAKTVLEGQGFYAEVCATALQAMRSFRQSRPDMVIIDIGLPDGDGLDLCREMVAGPGERVPILFLTARRDLKTRLECFQLGAQDYIQKPFSVEELLARVKVHLQIKESHDELVRRNYELELRSRVRQDLADMIVHDLKTPLTSIKGTLDLIKTHGLISHEGYKNLIENAGSAADFMLLMINDMLDIGQAEQAGLKTEIVVVDLPSLLARVKAIFAGRCQVRGVALSCALRDGAQALATDHNLLFRILVNLIVNAMQFSLRGAEVSLECFVRGGGARFVVADRGPGVPAAEKLRIFEKYASVAPRETAEESGTGIGLTFCRLAAATLKGRIWVEDRPGGGSLFILELGAEGAGTR